MKRNLILYLILFFGSIFRTESQTMEVCPGYVPRGWVIVSYRSCAGCCGQPGEIVLMPTIKRIDNMPVGTTIEVCPQRIPRGWVTISYRSCAGCCGQPGELVQMPTIKRIDDLPVGTILEVCPHAGAGL